MITSITESADMFMWGFGGELKENNIDFTLILWLMDLSGQLQSWVFALKDLHFH